MSTNRYVKFNLDVNRPDIAPGLNFKKDEVVIIDPITIDKLLTAIPNAIEVSDVDPDEVEAEEIEKVKTPAQLRREKAEAERAAKLAEKQPAIAAAAEIKPGFSIGVEDPTGELSAAEYAEAKASITEV